MSIDETITVHDRRSMVDRSLPLALYLQIADVLAVRILDGEIGQAGPLPSESQIRVEFGVARGTARRAVAVLRERGIVVTVPALGSFIVRSKAGCKSPTPES